MTVLLTFPEAPWLACLPAPLSPATRKWTKGNAQQAKRGRSAALAPGLVTRGARRLVVTQPCAVESQHALLRCSLSLSPGCRSMRTRRELHATRYTSLLNERLVSNISCLFLRKIGWSTPMAASFGVRVQFVGRHRPDLSRFRFSEQWWVVLA